MQNGVLFFIICQRFFMCGGQVRVPPSAPNEKPLHRKGFSVFPFASILFYMPFSPFLYAYAYFCMPYYTPYAKRKCKTKMQNENAK